MGGWDIRIVSIASDGLGTETYNEEDHVHNSIYN